jgi:hypothetical protein
MKIKDYETNFYSIINNYHNDFESIKNAFRRADYIFWLFVLLLIPVILYFVYSGLADAFRHKNNVSFMFKIFIAGGLWLCLALIIISKKIKYIKQRLRTKLTIESDRIVEIESEWLRKYFPNNKPSDYLILAQKIDSIIELRNKYNKAEKSTLRNAFNKYILPEDAKSRITSALLALSAVIVALSISADVNIYTLFDQFKGVTFKNLIFAYLIIIISTFMLMCMTISMAKMTYYLIVSIFEIANSSTTFSKKRAENFINILLWHYSESDLLGHENKIKPRIRVKAGVTIELIN